MRYCSRIVCLFVLLVSAVAADSLDFTVQKINDYLIAYITPDPTLDIVDGNSYAILTSRGVFVVDANHFESVANQKIADLRTRTSQPIRWLLNTHWHDDHNTANYVFRDSFPNIQIIAQEATREILMRRQGEWIASGRDGEFATYRPYFDSMAQYATKPDGTPDLAIRDRARRIAAKSRHFDADSRIARIEIPDVSFSNRLSLHLDSLEIQIRWAGRANTPGDAFVWLPKDSIVITGDILVSPMPYCFGSFHTEWVAVLDSIIALKPKLILPGHGEPMRDLTYITTVRNAIADLAGQIHTIYDRGITRADSVARNMDLNQWQTRMAGTDEQLNIVYRRFFAYPLIIRELKFLRGEIGPVDSDN